MSQCLIIMHGDVAARCFTCFLRFAVGGNEGNRYKTLENVIRSEVYTGCSENML